MAETIKIGITGVPNIGKTSVLFKVIEMLEKDKKKVGGMITESITKGKERVGFKIIDWMTKKEGILAHTNINSEYRVSKYGVDLEVLEKIGVKAINDACEKADIIIIDEIGKIEIESEKFIQAIRKAIETGKPMIITLHKKSRNPILQDIRRRNDVRILETTIINRDLLPYKIVKLIRTVCK